MTNIEIVKKLIGSIQPIGESTTDAERFENLKTMCELVDGLVTAIDEVHVRNKHSKEASVIKAAHYASKFLKIDLGIEN